MRSGVGNLELINPAECPGLIPLPHPGRTSWVRHLCSCFSWIRCMATV